MADFKAEDHRLSNPAEPRRRDYTGGEDRHRESPPSYGEQGQQLIPDSRSTSGVVSFLSSAEREGRWQLPRRFRALAVMGNVELDLLAAEIGDGPSVIEAVAVVGNNRLMNSPVYQV